MVLNLMEGWRIRSDIHCWRVERMKVVTEKETGARKVEWEIVSYHGELDQALRSSFDVALRSIPDLSLSETLAEIQRHRDDFSQTVEQWMDMLQPEAEVRHNQIKEDA